jgi:hypothetical protein
VASVVYLVKDYAVDNDLRDAVLGCGGLALLFFIPEYLLLKAGKRNISKAVSIYNNGLPAPKTSDLSLKFGGTKSGGIGFTLTF